jgi:hypothetical protein
MSIETSIDTLTTNTTELLDVCVSLRDSTTVLISNAVTSSQNAAQIPLVDMAVNLIDTQTLFITYIQK